VILFKYLNGFKIKLDIFEADYGLLSHESVLKKVKTVLYI